MKLKNLFQNKIKKTVIVFAVTLFSATSFAADSSQVQYALQQVRSAQQALQSAEYALMSSLQNSVITCRIRTSLYTYDATGSNQAVAISNAKTKCKNSGTIPSVCDAAVVDVCF